jgi:anti-anti-sigma regulatory factor
MPVTLKLGKEKSTLCLDGQIDIGSSSELKKALLDAFSAGKRVSVSLQRVTDLDVTAVQLLWAASRQAQSAGIAFAFDRREPQEVTAALADVGLDVCLPNEDQYEQRAAQ